VSSRRGVESTVAPPPPEIVEEPDEASPRRGRRRGSPDDRTTPERTRRGSPADLPKRARTRRRFDNIPLIADAPSDQPAAVADHDPDWLTSGDLRMRRSTGQVIAHGREVSLTRPELGVLELLLRSGGDGVTPEAIKAAAGDGEHDPDAIVAQLRRKTGVRGRGQGVRKERVLLYFLGEDEAEPTPD
jgi:DNA-binding response OmpR family regulator